MRHTDLTNSSVTVQCMSHDCLVTIFTFSSSYILEVHSLCFPFSADFLTMEQKQKFSFSPNCETFQRDGESHLSIIITVPPHYYQHYYEKVVIHCIPYTAHKCKVCVFIFKFSFVLMYWYYGAADRHQSMQNRFDILRHFGFLILINKF